MGRGEMFYYNDTQYTHSAHHETAPVNSHKEQHLKLCFFIWSLTA